jgi:hypothetical protein
MGLPKLGSNTLLPTLERPAVETGAAQPKTTTLQLSLQSLVESFYQRLGRNSRAPVRVPISITMRAYSRLA